MVIFGGTGKMGFLIAEYAIHCGYQVVCFGRTASVETVPLGAIPFQGNVIDRVAVNDAIQGASVVVIALSISRKSRSPFSRITGARDLHSQSMKMILQATNQHGIERIVKLSAQGVGDSRKRAGLLFRVLVKFSNLKVAFRDHAVADDMLKQSESCWTIVRPPILTEGDGGGRILAEESITTKSNSKIARVDVANWIVNITLSPEWYHRCVSIIAE